MIQFEYEFFLVVGESLTEDGAQIFDTILGELGVCEQVIVFELGEKMDELSVEEVEPGLGGKVPLLI